MMNLHKICVLDFETTGVNPDTCEPTQLAAVMVDPRKLEIIPGSEFNTLMCPPNIGDEGFAKAHEDNLNFHSKVFGKSHEDILKSWREAPSQKNAWETFVDYLSRYHTRQDRRGIFTAPLCAGYNILQYDWVILNRLSQRYDNVDKDGKTNLFYSRDRIDVMLYSFMWFENMNEPKSYAMDNLREFLGISKAGGHDALKDVIDTANIIIRFQRLCRRTAEKVKFKDSFSPEPIVLPEEV